MQIYQDASKKEMPLDAFVIQHVISSALNVGEKTNTSNAISKSVYIDNTNLNINAIRKPVYTDNTNPQ